MNESKNVPDLVEVFPEIFKAQGKVIGQLLRTFEEVELPGGLVELVNVRVSQLNGCALCLVTHASGARDAGVEQAKLDVLAAWREQPGYFAKEECAALELAEEITLLPHGNRHLDAARKAREVFTEEQLAALEWAIILINTYNRISIMSGHQQG
ncbi:carboxymuconolactone decarboxylase family protein [Corynebacterium cystitidis]|uniref:Alkylhydroperoxidase AhpD family core domain-containing protein n=1 Tax=Corynebacterium cystitidis DSM 20524 TaxID=1121357 RepID=A0A1H9UZQ0_9CORY|nr:carboxymuconolactone decarboxylase family protein [Corynebacterium cystitidis]WJY83620.1 Carboxymuconolactone decarboxylase family protein [Corynebacterium cystitidis DSM 20524]SES14791.1 alkylhydroperoxidase AhpD family core domain-containing protein [Corynebacterium cystitidis DSM 20524]SNV91698.1 Arsenate reductase and related proteins, glutaredoxin family [Corynebacterium cystitidis]